jgi:hypothetical protein
MATEMRGRIENVKKVKLEARSGDLSFYGPKGELVWRIPEAYELGLRSFSFMGAKSKARLVGLEEERDVELEAEFAEPVSCEVYEEEVVCSKY